MTEARRAQVVCAVAVLWSAWLLSHAYRFDPAAQVRLTDIGVGPLAFGAEAAARAARAVAGAGLVWLAAWQLGQHLARWLARTRQRTANSEPSAAIDPIFVLAFGVLGLSECLLLLAAFGAYRGPAVIGLLAACVLSRPRGAVADARLAIAWIRGLIWRGLDSAGTPWAVAIGLACVFALVAAFGPEVEYDALWYHLWLPARWLEQGTLADVVEEYPSLYPAAWELLNGAALVTGGPIAAKLLHFACLPLVAWAGCLVAREFAPGASCGLVAALIVTAPTVLWEASTAYVDLSLTWFVTLGVVAAARYRRTRERAWLSIAALMLGGAMAIKHLGLIALAVIVLWLLVHELRRGTGMTAMRAAAVATLMALAIPAPWYGRAWYQSGNPVFPELYGAFGAQPPSRWSGDVETSLARFKAHFGMGRTPAAVAALPWNVTVHGARFGGTLGPLFLLLVPFGFLARDARKLAVLAAGILGYGAVWASPLGSFQVRFLLPIVPLLAVIAAAGAAGLSEAARRVGGRRTSTVGRIGLLLLLVVNLPPFIDWHETDRQGRDGWLTHVLRGVPAAVVLGAESTDEYLARTVPTYRAWRAIDARTPSDARVLTFAGGDHLYSHRARLWADAAAATPITWGALAGDERRMIAAAQRAGITHVLFDKQQETSADFRALAIASAETRRRWLVPFYEDARIEVLAIAYPEPAERESAASDR